MIPGNIAIGKIVYYVNKEGTKNAAIITGIHNATGDVSLTVFSDQMAGVRYLPNVKYSNEGRIDSWHFPVAGAL